MYGLSQTGIKLKRSDFCKLASPILKFMVWRCVGFTFWPEQVFRLRLFVSNYLNVFGYIARAKLERMLLPDLMIGALDELKPDLLKANGIKGLVLDLDDTLIASNASSLADAYRLWLELMKTENIPLVILSNGSPKRVRYWAQELSLPAFALSAKPFLGFNKALRQIGTKASETAMIGDQLFTDILGAKLAGMKTILVQPLTPGQMLHTRFLRHIESLLLKGGEHGRSFYRG